MPFCQKCGNKFPFLVKVNGQQRNLCSRKFCLDCSPFGEHNTRDLTGLRSLFPNHTKKTATQCKNCGRERNEVHFYDGYAVCKACVNRGKRERDITLKKKAIEYKGGRCLRCGFTGHYASFDFHHLRDKEMVWHMMRNCGWEKIQAELEKCELLCANCHRVAHTKMHH